MVIKLILIWFACVALFGITALTMVLLTGYLGGKPKSNKFRKWWSENVVDLDNLYH
jgi:hypothetical protein